jgi:SAM-dependent methyltransferase
LNRKEVEQAIKDGKHNLFDEDDERNKNFMQFFSVPLLKKLFPIPQGVRILSVGCGTGLDVEMLCDLGYDAWGIECGHRSLIWPIRKHADRKIRCLDDSLPFPSAYFDFVMCHQVLEHVGVVGDTSIPAPDWKQTRQRFIDNILRAIKIGGYLNIATPNRLFPIDPGHGANFLGVRVHGPFDRFLTSYGDMKRYFAGQSIRPLSSLGYYSGTSALSRGRAGRLISIYQKLLDRASLLHGSLFNPLTNVLVQRVV